MLGCKPIDTPMDSQKKFGIEKESTPVSGEISATRRRLIYLSHTRPDIGFAVSVQRIVTIKYTRMRIGQKHHCGVHLDLVLLCWEILLPGGHSKEPVHHDRTKHVEIDRHFITEKVTSETVKLNYVPTKHQTADILTKALPRPNFEDLTCKLGLYDIYSPA
ncbi:hypothetical protein AAG906_022022 [Vitis piasezkii]